MLAAQVVSNRNHPGTSAHLYGMMRRAWYLLLPLVLQAGASSGHEIWIELPPTVAPGEPCNVEICFGHLGQREGEERLAANLPRLSAWVVGPENFRQDLAVKLGEDCFQANFAPRSPGFYTVAARLEVGIMDRPFHSIPAETRIVMLATACMVVGQPAAGGKAPFAGQEVEIVPLLDNGPLSAGGVVQALVCFRGKPLGGPEAKITLNTAGDFPWQEAELSAIHWSIEAVPEPADGRVKLPILVAGPHTFVLRYTEEKPGTYEGKMDFTGPFSHLRPGDRFARTLFITTHHFRAESSKK
jgi:uncharacterized GH25 family protein